MNGLLFPLDATRQFVTNLHADQATKGGEPYIAHLLTAERIAVALWWDVNDLERCVCLLHDSVEDQALPLDIIAKVWGQEVKDAVRLVTRNHGDDYGEYIAAIAVSGNRAALRAKVADLTHNLDVERLKRAGMLHTHHRKYIHAHGVLCQALVGLRGAR